MNKRFVVLALLVIGLIGIRSIGKTPAPEVTSPSVEQTQIESKAGNAEPISDPVTIRIPKMGVETSIEKVGMEASGRMGVPSSEETVAWWKLGVKPGERGSAVVAGHFDSPQGTPGVFYDLGNLHTGDEIIVVDQNNLELVFSVTGQETFTDAEFPIQRVFADNSGTYLNLITCSGVFDKQSNNYEKRLVVFSKLK